MQQATCCCSCCCMRSFNDAHQPGTSCYPECLSKVARPDHLTHALWNLLLNKTQGLEMISRCGCQGRQAGEPDCLLAALCHIPQSTGSTGEPPADGHCKCSLRGPPLFILCGHQNSARQPFEGGQDPEHGAGKLSTALQHASCSWKHDLLYSVHDCSDT